jgi:hypothetical protein
LLDSPVIPGYAFTSVEVKETGFRFDGIFLLPDDLPKEPIYFIEVQFQSYPDFYYRCVLSILGKSCKFMLKCSTMVLESAERAWGSI